VTERCYDFHGVVIRVYAEDAEVGEAVDARLRHFRIAAARAADVDVELRTAAAGGHAIGRPDGRGRPVYDAPAGEVSYFDDEDRLYIDYEDRVRVLARPAEGAIVSSAAEHDVWLLSRPLLTLPLVEVLKRRGLYSVHAGGVALGGRAILFPGASGSGKSTLVVALARAGFGFLADDMVFLSNEADQGLRVHAFPDEADVSDRTAGWFPELASLVGATPAGWPKHRVRVEDTFAASVAEVAEPALVVLPRIGECRESTIEPADPSDALLELAPNVLLTERASSQAHLDALGRLVRSSRCYRLTTGRDFGRVAARLRTLLEGA
jgi:hypothetical protein